MCQFGECFLVTQNQRFQSKMSDKCKHQDFDASVVINRLEDTGVFVADVQIHCKQRETKFVFVGVPAGLDTSGAAVSVDGSEIRLRIAPIDEVFLSQVAGKLIHIRNSERGLNDL